LSKVYSVMPALFVSTPSMTLVGGVATELPEP
jgi:hypothetical protein